MSVALLGSLECAQGILKMGPCSAKQHGQSEFCVESAHDTTRHDTLVRDCTAAEDVDDTRGVVALRCIFPRTSTCRYIIFVEQLGRSGFGDAARDTAVEDGIAIPQLPGRMPGGDEARHGGEYAR
jgi:hypothetical protein